MIEIFIYKFCPQINGLIGNYVSIFYPTTRALDLSGISLISAQNSGGHQLFFGAFHSYHLY